MKLNDEFDALAAELGRMAAELKGSQEKLLSFGRRLDASIAERTEELLHARAAGEASLLERTAELTRRNEVLRARATELSKTNREITLVSKMNDLLQTSTTEAEAYSVISETVMQLFPEDSGAVFVLNGSRDMLEAAAVWGVSPPANLIFPPNECRAYRRGQVHLALGRERRCSHVTDDGMYVCLPLLAQGEILGIQYLRDGESEDDRPDEERMLEKCTLAKTLADNVGLGIANLKLRESMRNLSVRDPLTGLFNRRYLEEVLAQEQHRVVRNGAQLAVVMIDIDHFKQFNDTFGHAGGDAVLRALGVFLRNNVRRSDTVCRYGGEEFALILSPSTEEGARNRAENIRAGAELLEVHHENRPLGAVTLSLGLAMFPDNASDAVALVKAADMALYRAKHEGRNRVVLSEQRAQSALPEPPEPRVAPSSLRLPES